MGHKVTLFVCFFVLLLETVPVSCQVQGDQNEHGTEVIETALRNRRKRASPLFAALNLAARMGKNAAIFLRHGSSEVDKGSRYYKYFEKRGNYQKALSDFLSVKPESISLYEWKGVKGVVGKVGDRSLILKKQGYKGRPTLEVIKNKELEHLPNPPTYKTHVADIISYID